MIQANPALAGSSFNDPRMISVIGALMGIDMEGFAREQGSEELPPGLSKQKEPPSPPSSTAPKPSTSQPPKEDVKMAEPEEPEEDDEEAQAKKAALAEKEKGNSSYKKREFAAAIESFKKAWELWPKDVTFLTNMAGEIDIHLVERLMLTCS